MLTQEFTAIIRAHPSGGAFVEVPFDVEKVFGRKRVKVVATFDGEPYRGLLTRMGTPQHMLPVRKDIRAKIGKGPGDEVEVTIKEDLEPRIVIVPPDIQRLLDQHPDAGRFFSTLSYTHQREYIEWIEEAKKADTRERRKLRMIDLLLRSRKSH